MRPVKKLLHRASGIGREMKAVVRQGALMARRERGNVAPIGDRAAVFVHGYMAGGPVFDPMRAHVERRAGVETFDLSYGPHESFDSIADRIASLVTLVQRGRPVTLVGHSLGGLLARWYTQELGGAVDHGGPVDRIITIASPHGGTPAARLAPGSLGAALRPGSHVVERLRQGRAKVPGVQHVALVAGRDRMIPPESARQIDDAEIHVIDDLGHNEALFDDRVHDHVVRSVR
jgi:triacylglycerol esterase/lipase EstA (alpha/beta hydrolase family)